MNIHEALYGEQPKHDDYLKIVEENKNYINSGILESELIEGDKKCIVVFHNCKFNDINIKNSNIKIINDFDMTVANNLSISDSTITGNSHLKN